MKTMEQLPEDATWDDIQERIDFVAGVRKGLPELDEGNGIPREKVREVAIPLPGLFINFRKSG